MSTAVSRVDEPPAKSSVTPTGTITTQTAIDRRLDKLIQDVLPTAPYILRLQQSSGRRLPQPSQAYHWRQGTLFSPDEQELQYMTFRRPLDNMLHAHGQWDDGRGGIAIHDKSLSHNSSGHTPLQGLGVKKKITLADYKNRDKSKNGVREPVPAQLGPNTSPEVEKSNNTQADVASNRGTEVEQTNVKQEHVMPKLGVGISVVDEAGSVKLPAKPINATESQAPGLPMTPPTKKPRLTVEGQIHNAMDSDDPILKTSQTSNKSKVKVADSEAPSAKHANTSAVRSEDAQTGSASHKPPLPDMTDEKRHSQLPPMLSPTLPNVEAYKLPPLLSPNLPPEIEAAIAEAKANRPKSNGSITASSRAPSASISSNRHRSDTATSLSQNSGDLVVKSKSPVPSNTGKRQNEKPASMDSNVVVADQRPPKEVAKLKLNYIFKIKKKQNRSRLNQYLRLKPTPSKVHWKRRLTSQHTNLEFETSKPLLPVSKHETTQEQSEPIKKRRRGSDQLPQRPETPALPASSPPSSKITSTQKSRLGAPSSHPTSTAMRRAGSGQGVATTPLGQSRHVTPSAIDKESPSKQELRAECRAESARLTGLGRDLKHDADPFLKNENPTAEQEKSSLVVATESILCFMLAWAVVDDQARRDGTPGVASQWKSMLRYISVLTDRSKPYRYLHGLLRQLEGVIRDIIHHHDMFTIRGILRELEKADGAELETATLQKHHSALKECNDNETRALVAWREGHTDLWITDIQSAFPKTWSKARQTPGRGKGQDPVQMKDYTRDGFALPMGCLTSGLEAVNAGWSLLSEYCEKEKIVWKPKLAL